ncbi:guanine nucleotide exchange factor MSS4 homolog [Cimex lectularius]|uniref:Guanine nucleotide exchange factor MSS4 homolog n=1 Tax=Cimex lectularius TaxID=79782 RepID=A0A8I6RAJ3_CIMLE|nr:guanine nucleotide exchange factor MSS4 homolog [Cimex lectularius]
MINLQDVVEEGKNKVSVFCSRCPSKILNSKSASYKSIQMSLPYLHKKGDNESQAEELTDFWEVLDMYTFENMGFSNTMDDKKYLICADCEMGPLGWHDLTTKVNYVALSRVKHNEDVAKK